MGTKAERAVKVLRVLREQIDPATAEVGVIEDFSEHPLPDTVPAVILPDHKITQVPNRRRIRDHARKAAELSVVEQCEGKGTPHAALDHLPTARLSPIRPPEQRAQLCKINPIGIIGECKIVVYPFHEKGRCRIANHPSITQKNAAIALLPCSAKLREMRVPYFHVDAFTKRPFSGNPAGVCLLDRWVPDSLLQNIAAENNLSETAFLVGGGSDWALRWFTPTVEVDLCGHATLAAAFVIFTEIGHTGVELRFQTASGELCTTFTEGAVMMDFPARPGEPCCAPAGLIGGLGHIPNEVLKSRDFLAVLKSGEEVSSLNPDFAQLATLECLGIIATARGSEVDFVSRFFAPRAGILEDPVTGSAHCTLIPYWAEKLGKKRLTARQLSRRGGTLHCEMRGDRVGIGGNAALYSRAQLEIPD